MANATRKERHSYKLSYAQEVGSSIDPDLEDVASWEQELAGMCLVNIFFHPKGFTYIYVTNPPKLIPFFSVMQFRTRPSPMVLLLLLLGHHRGKNSLLLILMTKNSRLMQKNVLLWLISMIFRRKNYLVGVI